MRKLWVALFVTTLVVSVGTFSLLGSPLAHATTIPPAGSVTSANLLMGDQSTFDASTGGWGAINGAVSDVSLPTQAGSGALALTTTAAGPANVWVLSGGGPGTWTAAVPGDRYSGSAFVESASVAGSVTPFEAFYDTNGKALTSFIWGEGVSDSPSAWTRLPSTVAIAPPNSAYVVFGMAFVGTATGEVHYVDSASLTSTSVAPTPVAGPLHTAGNQIIQATGIPITFRGIMRAGTDRARFPSDAEIGQAHAWGANFIRVPLNESLWLNTCTSSNPSNLSSYPSSIDAAVNSITSRHMFALLDLHVNVTSTCGAAGQQAMADSKYAQKFWSNVASRYKSNPLVGFDLYNEPHDITDAQWLNGGTVTYAGVSFSAVGMQRLYTVVRGTGATNLIFVSGNNWANNPTSTLVSGKNVVNAVHDYTCSSLPCTSTDPYNPYPILSNWIAVSQTQPVMITEAGFPNSSNGIYFNYSLVTDAESLGFGWDSFAWDGTTTGEFDLLASNGLTYEPSPSGMAILWGLARN